MREDLLDDNTCVRITKPRSRQATCVWTGRKISRGNDAIAIRDENQSNSALVWLGIDAAEELEAFLRDFDPATLDPSEQGFKSGALAPSGEVGYYEVTTNRYHCFVCGGDIEGGEGVVYFRRERRRASCRLRCHVGCTETIADGLNNAWEYTTEVLQSHL